MPDAPRPLTDGPVNAFMRRRRDRLGWLLADALADASADVPHPVLSHAVGLVRERLADMRLPEGPRLVIDPLGGLAPEILRAVWPPTQAPGPAAAAVLADAFPVREMGMPTRETPAGRGAQTDGPKGRGLFARVVERLTGGLSGGGRRRPQKRSGVMYAPTTEGRFDGLEAGSQSVVIDLGGLGLGWPPGDWFAEMARLLAPGGLYLCLSPGPTTLADLWTAWGRSVPVSPFWHDLHDLGDAMATAGFAAPVAESERLVLTYARSLSALRDLRAFPVRTAERAGVSSGLMGQGHRRQLLAALEAQRDTQGRIALRIECVLTHAWKPSPRADAQVRSGQGRAVPVQWHPSRSA